MKHLLGTKTTVVLMLAGSACAGKLADDQDFYRVVRDAGSADAGNGGASAPKSANQVSGAALAGSIGGKGGAGGSLSKGGAGGSVSKGGAGGAGGSVSSGGAGGSVSNGTDDVFNDDDMVVKAGAGGSAAVGGAGGRGGAGGKGGAGGAVAMSSDTAACDFHALVTAKCGSSSCHGAPASSTGLDLTSADLATRVAGRKGKAACTDKLLVDPNNPSDSKLYLKVTGSTCGSQMPLGGMLTKPEQECVLTWIENL